jgi:hypothetical protein
MIMNAKDFSPSGRFEPDELKEYWQEPVIEYLNWASSEADGGANFDGTNGSS